MVSSALRLKADKAKMRPAEELYIALAEIDFSWTHSEVDQAIKLWVCGYPVDMIASKLKRPVPDTFILLFDLAESGKIDSRPGGVFGNAGCGVN